MHILFLHKSFVHVVLKVIQLKQANGRAIEFRHLKIGKAVAEVKLKHELRTGLVKFTGLANHCLSV